MASKRGEPGRREQILEAAFEEFAAKGFNGATIKDIAEAAGVNSPALIYWYFPDKEALFREVLSSRIPVLRAVREPAKLLERPPEEVLPLIARRYLSTFDDPTVQKMARLLVGEAMRRPEIAEIFGNAVIKRILGFLKSYMAHQVELGRLRPHDVRSSARAFIGMLLPQAGGKLFLPAITEDGLTDDEHVENAVGVLLEGLRLEEE
ncbi:MAG: TetR/AcrR family transcriptional regulator [Rubrobacteraceae bacterium]|uniref:TetR/AcrR family transcriptional regulator n=1 Tax=Rubrobacter naiadicus TaxID=1392641 RepID=UPI00235F794F|nr:TetR/AcrR family transcriptional regulator [Rubrobacter naiadicus]MBX6762067.1 TetR/AcrR family transcriptional regulator [Rubrobacteraceae bacterium]MCL6437908.1 TetR/AcrR family transcriptional regulator [Rubrobacteraceae bacterium]